MIYFTYLNYKRKEISKINFFFWSTLWIAGFFLIVFHKSINKILPEIQIVRVMDLYMILSFLVLFSLIFYIFKIVKRNEKKIEEIARSLALKEIK